MLHENCRLRTTAPRIIANAPDRHNYPGASLIRG